MNRRNFLLLSSAAGGLVALGGGAFVLTDNYHGWVSSILHRSLPGYTVEPKGLGLFIEEHFAHQKSRKKRLFAAAEGLVDLTPIMPAGMATHVAAQERAILTDFLIGSDFFQHFPNGPKEITYRGKPTACVSPFARFDT
jgi:hypothetical protein